MSRISNPVDNMVIMPLGGGQEVGRSSILLQYKSRNIILDCGVHPGRKGYGSLPEFYSLPIDPSEIDLVLITHFHMDHCASLPYLTEKLENFNAKIFMTHATKAVMALLVSDYIRVSGGDIEFDRNDLQNCLDKVEVIDFHQTREHKGVKFTATPAGHVLGAAMFTIDIAGVVVLYTGDYSMEEDRHLEAAEIPSHKPDILIVESTFGIQLHPSKEHR